MRIQFISSTVAFCGVLACTSKSSAPTATAEADASVAPTPKTTAPAPATTSTETRMIGPDGASIVLKEGDVIDPNALDPHNPLKAILLRAADGGTTPEYANLDNVPKKPIEGTYNEKTKFEKVQIECTDTGYRLKLMSAKDGDKYFIAFPLKKEPAVGINLGAPSEARDATLTIDGVTWRLQHSWAADFKTYKAAPFKGKEAVLGHASGRLVWVPFGEHGLKITRVAGTFADAPIKALANCAP